MDTAIGEHGHDHHGDHGARVAATLDRACRALLTHLRADGSFEGDVDQGTGPTAQTVILERFLGILQPADAADAIRWLCNRAQPDGGFLAYPGATFATLTETCCAYGAMVAAGLAHDDPRCVRARAWIDAHGGFDAADPISKAYLVMARVLPASVLPPARIEHVLVPGIDRHVGRTFMVFYGFTLGFVLPAIFHGLQRGEAGGTVNRVTARAEHRMVAHLLSHQNPEGSWAGSHWLTTMTLAALNLLGVPLDHDAFVRGLASLRRLRRVRPDGLEVISLNADVWNTAMALRVLTRAGAADAGQPWVRTAVAYLLESQGCIAIPDDWSNARPGAPRTGGWAFEAANPLSTDSDSTSMVLLALADYAEMDGVDVATRRGVQWLLSMEHDAGGFAAFGRPTRVAPGGPQFQRQPDAPKGLLAQLRFFVEPPFEFAETPTADLTGRVMCALARVGGDRGAQALARATSFLSSQQWHDVWWGRWTTNYLAATAFVLQGLSAAGVPANDPRVSAAVRWTLAHQNADGGFGECNESYAKPELAGTGPSNAYLTGLVLQALCATGHARSSGAMRAAAFLCDSQRDDGLWEEFQAVQTVAPPEMFYKNFVNFQTAPIEALAIYRDAR